MASHVFVIDSAARRSQIKTSPSTYLRDVLEQACKAKGINADQYELKQGNKVLDLSLSIRLSGLTSGAKLDLVQSSRTPAVVSIALQLPESAGSARLTDRFPSNTSLWQILRRFESGAAGQGKDASKKTYNFTQRGIANLQNRASGAGRMCYEMPVIVVLGRELATLVDLQKTLGQLGLNKGNSLLRLNFKSTEQPIEEAMIEISQFFRDDQPSDAMDVDTQGSQTKPQPDQKLKPAPIIEAIANIPSDALPPSSENPPSDSTMGISLETAEAEAPTPQLKPTDPTPDAVSTSTHNPAPLTGPDARPIAIFQPPSTNTPHAALTTHNPTDYEPTLDHAKSHQASLVARGRNTRLLSDAELASQESAKRTSLSRIASIEVVIRMPDQSRVQATFTRDDTTAALYRFVRGVMQCADEPFVLRYMDAQARPVEMTEAGGEADRLIQGLGLRNRTLVSLVWGDEATPKTRQLPCLKEEYRERAQALKVQDEFAESRKVNVGAGQGASAEPVKEGKGKGRGDVESKMKKFLGLSKK